MLNFAKKFFFTIFVKNILNDGSNLAWTNI